MDPIIVATRNKNKLQELRSVSDNFGLSLFSLNEAKDRYQLPPAEDVEENGLTFLENARLKAQACMKWSQRPSIGDDSGIEVDALLGMPGIYSARYAGPGASDGDRMNKLLSELAAKEAAVKDPGPEQIFRRARFRCALVLCLPDGREFSSEANLEGHILREPRGSNGFGYDPILHIEEFQKTLAEVDFDFTCREGFRARAARALFLELASVL